MYPKKIQKQTVPTVALPPPEGPGERFTAKKSASPRGEALL
jgi:hypothetical protein